MTEPKQDGSDDAAALAAACYLALGRKVTFELTRERGGAVHEAPMIVGIYARDVGPMEPLTENTARATCFGRTAVAKVVSARHELAFALDALRALEHLRSEGRLEKDALIVEGILAPYRKLPSRPTEFDDAIADAPPAAESPAVAGEVARFARALAENLDSIRRAGVAADAWSLRQIAGAVRAAAITTAGENGDQIARSELLALSVVQLLVRLDLASSEAEGRRAIVDGEVYVDGRLLTDPADYITSAPPVGQPFTIRCGEACRVVRVAP